MSKNELVAKIEALNEWELLLRKPKQRQRPSGTASRLK